MLLGLSLPDLDTLTSGFQFRLTGGSGFCDRGLTLGHQLLLFLCRFLAYGDLSAHQDSCCLTVHRINHVLEQVIGFQFVEGAWEKELESEKDMPKIIAQAVEEGLRLYEARLIQPTLKEIYTAWLEGGKRKVVESHETADESPADADGTVWEEDEEFSEEWGEQLSGEDFQNAHGEEPEPGEEPEGESEEV